MKHDDDYQRHYISVKLLATLSAAAACSFGQMSAFSFEYEQMLH